MRNVVWLHRTGLKQTLPSTASSPASPNWRKCEEVVGVHQPDQENADLAEVERLRSELEFVRAERDRFRDAVEILRVELKKR